MKEDATNSLNYFYYIKFRYPPKEYEIITFSDEGPPLTIKELRTVTILREIPFVVPFSTRVLIFQGLLMK